MPLVLRRLSGETWREAALRLAEKYHLAGEVAEIYDHEVAAGVEESQAAWDACYEWDVLLYEEE